MKKIQFKDLGLISYVDALDLQVSLFDPLLKYKLSKRELNSEVSAPPQVLLFCEHPHVYTLGKSGSESNLLINEEFLKSKGASFYKTNRGGDITYHGPGQIVGYPILDLERYNMGVREYIYSLEESVIQTLKKYDIQSERLDGATGVWIDVDVPGKTRKICAIGVKVSRHVSMHGFAFNVNTNLDYFNFINPCGFTDKQVTSVQKEVNKEISLKEIKMCLKEEMEKQFGFELTDYIE